MITVFGINSGKLVPLGDSLGRPDEAIWIDLFRPTPEEEALVERQAGLDVPTREEMLEIELSSRLYEEGGATFMTANILSHTDSDDVVVSPITFIVLGNRLITVRYEDPRTFGAFTARGQRVGIACPTPGGIAVGLLEASIERLADVLERTTHDLEVLSKDIFRSWRLNPADRRRQEGRSALNRLPARSCRHWAQGRSRFPRTRQPDHDQAAWRGGTVAGLDYSRRLEADERPFPRPSACPRPRRPRMTLPSRGAVSVCSIFMASRTTSGSPRFTSWPTAPSPRAPCPASARGCRRRRRGLRLRCAYSGRRRAMRAAAMEQHGAVGRLADDAEHVDAFDRAVDQHAIGEAHRLDLRFRASRR